MAEMELMLNSPITEEQWDAITDVDFDKTDRIWFQTKHGKTVEFVKAEPPTIKAAPPSTNADRIRARSDEELADAFAAACPQTKGTNRCCEYYGLGTDGCRACWLDWLQSPAGGMLSE